MAAPLNTVLSTVAVGNREQLSDIVSRITPEDTPIYTTAGRGKTKGTKPEWEIDTLRAPQANAQTEGDDYVFDALAQPARVGNYTQIFSQGWVFSGTQQAVENAGNVVKVAEKKVKAGIELRKDVELAIVANTASVGGATRLFGSLPSWLTTNVARNSGSNGGYNNATGLTVAETPGTLRAFTKALLDNVMQQCYVSGANVSNVIVSPYNKSVFVTFMSDTNVAVQRHAVEKGKGATIIGTADFYEGPYGKVMVEPNRVMAASAATARRVFLLDPEFIDIATLRPIQEDPDLAKTGDNKKGVIIGELALKVKNEAALGVVADVFGLTASS
jgi:Family of unknown function (DUF5309)